MLSATSSNVSILSLEKNQASRLIYYLLFKLKHLICLNWNKVTINRTPFVRSLPLMSIAVIEKK